jgi:hypothetical protein
VTFARLPAPAYSVCVRAESSVRISRVEPLLASLLHHCRNAPLRVALEQLSNEIGPSEVARVWSRLPALIQLALSAGYWVGLDPEGC